MLSSLKAAVPNNPGHFFLFEPFVYNTLSGRWLTEVFRALTFPPGMISIRSYPNINGHHWGGLYWDAYQALLGIVAGSCMRLYPLFPSCLSFLTSWPLQPPAATLFPHDAPGNTCLAISLGPLVHRSCASS
jgi:hypothetical protein